MLKEAEIDQTGQYRYWLRRLWDPKLNRVLWVMLNPSKADHEVDDPTIKRCIDFTKRWGFGGFDVINLFAHRATDPGELSKQADPIGPENDDRIIEALAQREIGLIVAAWGAKGGLLAREARVKRILLTDAEVAVMCLGTTGEGHPKHPLYVPAAKELELFE